MKPHQQVFDRIDLDHFQSTRTRPLLNFLKAAFYEQYDRDKRLFKEDVEHVFSPECLPPVYVAYAKALINAEVRTLAELRECDSSELVDCGIPLGHAKHICRALETWKEEAVAANLVMDEMLRAAEVPAKQQQR